MRSIADSELETISKDIIAECVKQEKVISDFKLYILSLPDCPLTKGDIYQWSNAGLINGKTFLLSVCRLVNPENATLEWHDGLVQEVITAIEGASQAGRLKQFFNMNRGDFKLNRKGVAERVTLTYNSSQELLSEINERCSLQVDRPSVELHGSPLAELPVSLAVELGGNVSGRTVDRSSSVLLRFNEGAAKEPGQNNSLGSWRPR